ncbi:MAG: glycosyltransferase [Planctomycetota bacterium]|nr:glycosyltransferase [Planctomycetota bacterium]
MTPLSFVFLSAVRYDHCLSGRTRRIADALASTGHDVTFVEMPSLKASSLRLIPFSRKNGDAALFPPSYPPPPTPPASPSHPTPRQGPGEGFLIPPARPAPPLQSDSSFIIHHSSFPPPFPAFLRFHSTPPARLWTRFVQQRLITRIPNLANAAIIVSTPWWIPILQDLPRRILCYDYIDHLTVHSATPIMSTWDDNLLAISDLVTTVSETLQHSLCQRLDPARIALLPNGVENAWLDSTVPPIPRSAITGGPDRPIAGFIGALFEWIDMPLLAAAAAALPHTLFVLAGPTRAGIHISPLRRFPNIRLFPAQPYPDVPRWIRAFDVCLIPFKNDLISHSADPIKLYEYLALGKPVVSSLRFGSAADPPPMLVADSPAQFAHCIRQSLQESNSHAHRISYARRNTWEKRASNLLCLLQDHCDNPPHP